MKAVTTSNFDTEILASRGMAVVFFHAAWCKACAEMNALVAAMEAELPDVTFAEVNTDASEEIVMQQGVRTIPTVHVFHDGRPTARIRGPIGEDDFRRELANAAQT
jgi:thioredoxin-like negative regulator of GroEL